MAALDLVRDAGLGALMADARTLEAARTPGLAALRTAAQQALGEARLPTLQDESYRFLPLAPLTATAFRFAGDDGGEIAPAAIAPWQLDEATAARLVFVNGVYAPALSAPPVGVAGLHAGPLAEVADAPLASVASLEDDVFTALNGLYARDGALVTVAANATIDQPVHLLFIATAGAEPLACYPRTRIDVGTGARLTLVEEYVSLGAGPAFSNAVTEVQLATHAEMQHARVQRESLAAVHIGRSAVQIGREARYTATNVNLGARLSRHNVDLHQTAPGSQAVLNGLTFITGNQEADTHSMLDHAHPAGQSQQVNKCVVGDSAHAVFNGRILVREGAQQTDSAQASRNLLLSPKARVDAKPQLEIFADDVKCAHGATVGQLEDDELFYLRSRGLDAAAARALLTYAFAADVIERLPVPSLAKRLEHLVLAAISPATSAASPGN